MAETQTMFLSRLGERRGMTRSEKEKDTDELYAKTQNLRDLISYQKASVVSRTLIDKKAGTVTLFAFDKEQGLSEHTAPYDALVQIIDGEAEVTISRRAHRLKEGEVIIMPANEPHALKAVGKFKMLLIMIRS
jgi:quercetin dioxygenase-like cupin family protein